MIAIGYTCPVVHNFSRGANGGESIRGHALKPKWSRFHDACLNCGTRRTPHEANGYCKRCWPMAERVRRAEKWNRSQPESMKRMQSIPRWTRDAIVAGLDRRPWSDEEFERYRSELIRQYRGELTWLRELEQSRHERVTGWNVEAQLRFVLSHVCPKATRNPFHGIARNLEDRFDSGQLSIIYGLLLDLVDHVPWKGIDPEEFWRRVCHKG